MDPLEKKKSMFNEDAIIKLTHNGDTKRVFYNQISSANLAVAFDLNSQDGLFLRRSEIDLIIFPESDGSFNVPSDGGQYTVEQRIMKAPAQEVVLDASLPSNTSNVPRIHTNLRLFNTSNNNTNKANTDLPPITDSNVTVIQQDPRETKHHAKEKKTKLKANNNNNNNTSPANNKNNAVIVEDMDVSHDLPFMGEDFVPDPTNTNTNNTNVNIAPTSTTKVTPKLKLTIEVAEEKQKNTSKSAKKKRNTAGEDDDDNEEWTPQKKSKGDTKKGKKKKRGEDSDDDDYAPQSGKKTKEKKRPREEKEEEEEWTTNKRRKIDQGFSQIIYNKHQPHFYFATSRKFMRKDEFTQRTVIPNGQMIQHLVKQWVNAVENEPEKEMRFAIPAEEKQENTEKPAESTAETSAKSLRKSPSQIKIEKEQHKVDVDRFYECLRPVDWNFAAPEKPAGLNAKLLAYQRRAVSWMIAQERRTRPRLPAEKDEHDKSTWGTEVILGGKGILADEMGLGKTIELIALILLNDSWSNMNFGLLPHRSDEKSLRVRNTLIVAPNILVNQWCSELQKHAPYLTVTIYDGMQTDPEITKTRIKESHVVITSYEVLRQEIHYIDDFHMALRRSSQVYDKPKTPLVNCIWWRVCIDEAQEVKTSTNQAAAMVSKIPAIHRWAVSGTPIKSSFEDIRGLLIFLRLEEYWDKPTKELLPLLGKIMWRHAKAHVQDDIAIPGTTMHRDTLNLSKFEKFCLEFVVKKQKSLGEDNQNAQNELAKFFSAPYAVVYDLMETKKKKFTDKNKSTCLKLMFEESIKETRQKQAQLCDIMNEIGDAAYAMIEKDPKRVNMLDLARDSYQSILDLIFENKESDIYKRVGRIDIGDDTVMLPALLNSCPGAAFHALVNLSRVSGSRDKNKDPQNDEFLERAQLVQLQHLGPIKNDVAKVAEKFKKWKREINAISGNRKNNYRSPWWVRILKFIQSGKSPHFSEQSLITSLQSGVIQSYNTIFTEQRSDELKLSVQSIDELIARIGKGLKDMEDARIKAVKSLKGKLPVSMREMDEFERSIAEADANFTKYESAVAMQDMMVNSNALDKKDALIQTKKSAKLNETERILLFLERIVINDSNYYFHLIVPKTLTKNSTNARDREVLSILTEVKPVPTINLTEQKTDFDRQSLISEMKFVKNISQVEEPNNNNNENKIDFEKIDPFLAFSENTEFQPRMDIDEMPNLENAENNNNNNNNEEQQQEENLLDPNEAILGYKHFDSYNPKTEKHIHHLSLCFHEASAQFKEFEYIKLEVLAAWDLIESCTKYAKALKEFESKSERRTFDNATKEEINNVIQSSINRRAEATTACKKQLEDIAFLLNERKLLQEARAEESYGTKLARIIDLLAKQLNEDQDCKALVFSSWSEPLVQLSDLLKQKSILYTAGPSLQGMAAAKTHAERINSFKENATIRVMLLSALKQSTGLTLTQANHVVLMDHVEKSSEDQAIGRAYRIGQTKSTHVYKYAVNMSDVKDEELKLRIKKINKDKVFIRSNVIDADASASDSNNTNVEKNNNNNNNNTFDDNNTNVMKS